MEQYDQIGARLDRLPLARFHYRIDVYKRQGHIRSVH